MAGFQWTGEEGFRPGNPEAVANEMFAGMRHKVRLTWNREDLGQKRAALEAGRIGNFFPRMPYVNIHKRYYIQNGRILDSAGQYISIEDIPDGLDKNKVVEAYMNYRAQALEADPKLCQECALVRFENPEEMIRHLAREHPEKFKEIAEEGMPKVKPEPEKGAFACAGCDETFDTAGEMIAHAKTHNRVAAGA